MSRNDLDSIRDGHPVTIMQHYCYEPLDSGPSQTRLLIIQPARSVDAPLRCRVVPHELQDPYERADSYDALSYAWGSSELTQQMWIDEHTVLPITQNLYEALVHLRHCSLERTLWADAVCIDQSNDREKERQIMIMRRIYAHAQCVIVWLGPEADDSTFALHTIRDANFEVPLDYSTAGLRFMSLRALFSRPWFRRIWVTFIPYPPPRPKLTIHVDYSGSRSGTDYPNSLRQD